MKLQKLLHNIHTLSEPFKAQEVLYLPPGLMFKNLHFAYRVHVCVLYDSHN
jgi:hypothetical protein